MDYRDLGRTGVKVSPLCLGTMNFGARTDEATAIRMIDRAIDQGINVIDTANVYGTTSQLALAWAAQQPGITSVIIGPRTPAQLEDNLGCLPVGFTEDELAEIDRRSRPNGTLLTRS